MKDISDRNDIEQLIAEFYQKAMKDSSISHFFRDVVPLDLDKHLPHICDFWEATLFQNAKYSGNPMQVHLKLHQMSPLLEEHFNQWLNLFTETIDHSFQGEKANLAKQRAISIATLMKIKIHQSGQ